MSSIIHMDTETVREHATRSMQEFADSSEMVDEIKRKVQAIPWGGLTRELFIVEFNILAWKMTSRIEDGYYLSQKVQREVDAWLAIDYMYADKFRTIREQGVDIGKKIDEIGHQQMADDELQDARTRLLEWWKTLTTDDKKQYLQSLYERICKLLGIEPVPLSFPQLDDPKGGDLLGSFNEVDKDIRIDVDNLEGDSPFSLIDTIAHETRHQFQNNTVRVYEQTGHLPDGVSVIDVNVWKFNEDHYITYQKWPDGYSHQPIETDAQNYGADFVNQILFENRSTGGGGGGGGGGGAW
jgi:hypothetical protein